MPASNGPVSNIPEINMDMLFACLFLFDDKNKPKINGIKNKIVMGSNLIWNANDEKPTQNLSILNWSNMSDSGVPINTKLPTINKITKTLISIILWFFGISELNIKNIDIGENAAVNNLQKTDSPKIIGDTNQTLITKYNDKR